MKGGMMNRVTLQDIAKELGVHHTTVSRALANHPRIGAATCKKIQSLAQKRGYVPDPFLTGLAAYRKIRRTSPFTGVLGCITNWPARDAWRDFPVFVQYFEGASARASELGYRIEEFWLREPGHTTRRILNILQARGVQGLIFMPQPESHTRLAIDLRRFSSITFGTTLESPVLHSITSKPYATMLALLGKLRELGYRRPALVASAFHEERVTRQWSAAFWAYVSQRGTQRMIPPLILERLEIAPFRVWLKKYQPDVLIATDFEQTRQWLEHDNWKIPDEIGLVPPITFDNSYFSGMNENAPGIGAVAVEQLVRMLHRNECGVPDYPLQITVAATWQDGFTVRKQ